MCLYPKIIKNRKYIANKKNKGVIPTAKDKRVLYVPVCCGNCMECRKQKSRQWQVRLNEEIRQNKNGVFVTMTFDDNALKELGEDIKIDGYELDNNIAKKGTRRFLERWRKKYKKSVRHWLVTELGQTNTERIHIHGIIWTDEKEDIGKIWKYGHVYLGEYVSEKTINYIVKYINKTDVLHKEYKSIIMTSAGIGKGYTQRIDARNNKYKKKGTTETYTTRQGAKLNLPIYYRNQIYTEKEREKLWIEKLDKEERWINGKKIDISNGEEEYYKVLEEERRKNKRLGYGDNTSDWNRKQYERERRNLIKKGKIWGSGK